MSEIVERVAKAIFDAWADAEGSETTWDQLVEMQGMDGYANSKKHYKMAFDEARAAIVAMKEATYEMLLEGQSVVNLTDTPGHFEYISRDETQEIWETMIGEALK